MRIYKKKVEGWRNWKEKGNDGVRTLIGVNFNFGWKGRSEIKCGKRRGGEEIEIQKS